MPQILKRAIFVILSLIIIPKTLGIIVFWIKQDYLEEQIGHLESFVQAKDLFVNNFELFQSSLEWLDKEDSYYLYQPGDSLEGWLMSEGISIDPLQDLWKTRLMEDRYRSMIIFNSNRSINFVFKTYESWIIFFDAIDHHILYDPQNKPEEKFQHNNIIKYKKLKENWYYVIIYNSSPGY